MTSIIKTVGLALVAVLAMGGSATVASAAEFHSETAHTILTGAQPEETNDVLTVNAGTVTCKSVIYSGTRSSATSSSITVIPSYASCTAFGFISSTIDVPSGCSYTLAPHETIAEGEHWEVYGPGALQITCTSSPIRVTAFNCHVSLGSQTLAHSMTYDNRGSGTNRDFTATAEINGLKYTQESKSFPGCTNGTFTNGTYKGSATMKGTDTFGSAVGIWQGV